jgi:hypothetical protein
MKINAVADLTILAKCEPTKSQDGKNTYYKLTYFQGVEAGQLSCSEYVYNNCTVGKPSKYLVEYGDTATNNGSYKSFRIVGIAENVSASAK